MDFVDLDSLDHQPDLATALGSMVVVWARAETALVKTYVTVTGLHFNQAAAAYYNIPTFDSRIKALLALAQEVHSNSPVKGFEQIQEAIERLSTLSKTRNEWIHAVWVTPENGPPVAHTLNMKQPSHRRRAKPIAVGSVTSHNAAVRTQSRILETRSPVRIALKP